MNNQLSRGALHAKTAIFRTAHCSAKHLRLWNNPLRPACDNRDNWLYDCQLFTSLCAILGIMGILWGCFSHLAAFICAWDINRFHADFRIFCHGAMVRSLWGKCPDSGFYSAILERGEYLMAYQYAPARPSERTA